VALAVAVLVVALVPPLSSEARRLEVYQALQFALLALGVPALVVLGAPWRLLGLAAGPAAGADAEGIAVLDRPRLADRLAAARRRHPEPVRSLAFLVIELAVVVAWRTPGRGGRRGPSRLVVRDRSNHPDGRRGRAVARAGRVATRSCPA
jgi:hypothetical protein